MHTAWLRRPAGETLRARALSGPLAITAAIVLVSFHATAGGGRSCRFGRGGEASGCWFRRQASEGVPVGLFGAASGPGAGGFPPGSWPGCNAALPPARAAARCCSSRRCALATEQ